MCGVWRVACLMCPTLALYHAARRSPQAVITLIYAHGTLSPGSGAVGPSGETKAELGIRNPGKCLMFPIVLVTFCAILHGNSYVRPMWPAVGPRGQGCVMGCGL